MLGKALVTLGGPLGPKKMRGCDTLYVATTSKCLFTERINVGGYTQGGLLTKGVIQGYLKTEKVET